MARPRQEPRKAEKQYVTSTMLGSDNPEETAYEVATPGEYPEGREEADPGWKKAYDQCAKKGNPVGACVLFADAHEQD
jgi:hypothetical protein